MKYLNRIAIILSITCTMISCKTTEKHKVFETPFYVGTYTNAESKGIYKYQINSEGKLSNLGLMAETNNPSFITMTNDKKTLLAVDETNENGTGFVKSFRIKKDTLVFVSKSKSGGAHPCFITANKKNQVLVANYTGGNVGYLKVDNQNGLTNLLDLQQHTGKGITSRQEAPHAHSTWFHPKSNAIISVDLGTDELWFSKINSEDKLVFNETKKLKMKEGAGPRHLTFHPNNKWIYVLNELDNTVSLLVRNENQLKIDSSISMLPKDFTKYSKGADIHLSKDGGFLYASNRGHNSIVIYKIDSANGTLSLVGFESVKGANPRNFSLTPDNKYLIVANQDTNNLVSFKRDLKTGKLTFVNEIKAPTPVCILF